MPGKVVILAHTSTSGPYWALLRQAVQVVDSEHASVFEETLNPRSVVPPTMLSSTGPNRRAGSRSLG